MAITPGRTRAGPRPEGERHLDMGPRQAYKPGLQASLVETAIMASPSMFFAVLRERVAALMSGGPEHQTVHAPTPRDSGGDGLASANHSNAEAFQIVCRMLDDRHGRKIRNTPEGTLNRLFRKHLATHQPALADDAPQLTSDNTWVTRETRPKLDFVGLTRRLESGPRISFDSGHPIVIARYRGLDLLLDGNKRCRFWYRHADRGLHDAYVLIVREVDGR